VVRPGNRRAGCVESIRLPLSALGAHRTHEKGPAPALDAGLVTGLSSTATTGYRWMVTPSAIQCWRSITRRLGAVRVKARMQASPFMPTYQVATASKSPAAFSSTNFAKRGVKLVGPLNGVPP
jgi:hypothetical protein